MAVTQVAVGILLRQQKTATILSDPAERAVDAVLLAQRPTGKVCAGYWEFPGGKVEAGETAEAALARELHEELNITPTIVEPWLQRQHVYPHATVHLNFFRVYAWSGEIHANEHSQLLWQHLDLPYPEPLLPANHPFLKALRLPNTLLITDAEDRGISATLDRVQQALAAGYRFFQLRDKSLPGMDRRQLAVAMSRLINAYEDGIMAINDDTALAQEVNANALHYSSSSLHRLSQKSSADNIRWQGASIHNAADLQRASDLNLDYVVLGSVRPTASHPGGETLGWSEFEMLTRSSPIPLFAIGGMTPQNAAQARRLGAHGTARRQAWLC